MRISYPLSYEKFVALQPEFKPLDPVGRGAFFFCQVALSVAGAGFLLVVVTIANALGLTTTPSASVLKGLAILALGGLPVVGLFVWRRVSARRLQREHGEFLRDRYAHVHCRDRRFVETTDEGLRFGCACKLKVYPWNHLRTVVETDTDFLIEVGGDAYIVPKESFPDEATRTRFRALLSESLHKNRSMTARMVEFTCNRHDWRAAKWLQFKAGGFQAMIVLIVLACSEGVLILTYGPAFDDHISWSPESAAAACVFVVLAVVVALALREKPFQYSGPLKIWFGEDAIFVQSPIAEHRIAWSQVGGILADKRSLLILEKPNQRILIPRRAIGSAQRQYLAEILRAKFGRSPGPSPSGGESASSN